MRLDFAVAERDDRLAEIEREKVLRDPGFGKTFTDHMVKADPYAGGGLARRGGHRNGPLLIDPATAVLHYAQEIFEGMKAYRHEDGSVWTFRPEANAARFNRSARRLALPELPEHDFIESLKALVATDVEWVPEPGRRGEEPLPAPVHVCVGGLPRGAALRRGHLLRDRLAGRPPISRAA